MKVHYMYRFVKQHQQAFVVLIFDFKEWRDGSLKAHGFQNAYTIAVREATALDIEELTPYYRLHYVKYFDWNHLISDDRKLGVDEAFIARLQVLRKEYPLEQTEKGDE
jgi:asparagine synthetase A